MASLTGRCDFAEDRAVRRGRGPRHSLAGIAAGVVSAVALGACGGDGGRDCADPEAGNDPACEVAVGFSAFPNSLDPAEAYTTDGLQALWNVYTGLLTYRRAEGPEGTEIVPGLAERMPAVSADGRVYRLRLRAGLRYSDGTAVKASDFEHAVKRVVRRASFGTDFFLTIAGAETYAKSGRASGDISGIVADDRTRDITVRLAQADGRFPNILATTFAGLVPGDTPFRDLTSDPPPGVGPYRLTEVDGRRAYRLVRVPSFDVAGIPEGRVPSIAVRVAERRRLTQATIRNRVDVMGDAPAPDQLRRVRARHADRYREIVANSTTYLYLNEQIAPFDDPRVRQAANLATDQSGFARLFGGLLTPTCNLLPPGVPGFRKLQPCPSGDPGAAPDLQRARVLIRQAGARGRRVQVWGSDQPEFKASVEAFADVLSQIGLKATPRAVTEERYFATFGDASLGVQAGILQFAQDFPHPSNFFQLVASRSIPGGQNPGFVRDGAIDRTLRDVDRAPAEAARADAAAIDRRIAEQAHIVPLGNGRTTVFLSERMEAGRECSRVHPVYLLDYTSLCLK